MNRNEYLKNHVMVRKYAKRYFELRKNEIISFIEENDDEYKLYKNKGVEWFDYAFGGAYMDNSGLYIVVLIDGKETNTIFHIASIVYPQIIELYKITNNNKI